MADATFPDVSKGFEFVDKYEHGNDLSSTAFATRIKRMFGDSALKSFTGWGKDLKPAEIHVIFVPQDESTLRQPIEQGGFSHILFTTEGTFLYKTTEQFRADQKFGDLFKNKDDVTRFLIDLQNSKNDSRSTDQNVPKNFLPFQNITSLVPQITSGIYWAQHSGDSDRLGLGAQAQTEKTKIQEAISEVIREVKKDYPGSF